MKTLTPSKIRFGLSVALFVSLLAPLWQIVGQTEPLNLAFGDIADSRGGSTSIQIGDNDPGISFANPELQANENQGTVNVVVLRGNDRDIPFSVDYAAGGGTATAGLDFAAVSGTLTFAPGETTKTLKIPILDDGLVEGDETFRLTLSNPQGGAVLGPPSEMILTIRDNEKSATFLDPTFVPDLPVAGKVDSLTIQADGKILVKSGSGMVRLNQDGSWDGSFDLSGISGPFVVQPGGQIVFVRQDPERPGYTLARVNVDGSFDAQFKPTFGRSETGGPPIVILSALAAQPDGKILVAGGFDHVNGEARPQIARLNSDGSLDADFVPRHASTLFIEPRMALLPDGRIVLTIDLAPVLPTFLLRLNSDGSISASFDVLDSSFDPASGPPRNPERIYSIIPDSDGKIIITGSFTKINGVSSNGIARLNEDGSLDESFDAGTETPPTEAWPADLGVTTVATQPDGRILIAGTFNSIDGVPRPGVARMFSASANVIQLTSDSISVSKSDGSVTVAVERRGDSSGAVSVEYATGNGSAIAGLDFTPQTGTLAFAPLETEKTISIPILNDARPEPDETFYLTLESPSTGAILGPRTRAEIKIIDNDPSLVEFASAAFNVGEQDGTATIRVVRTWPGIGEAQVNYFTVNGTATEGLDYVAQSGTLHFATGQAEATFVIPILEDNITEQTEFLVLTLDNPSDNVILGPQSSAILRIADAIPTVQFATSEVTANEADRTVTLIVQRGGATDFPFAVNFETGGGTAIAEVDYVPVSGTLTFAAGEASTTITVSILGDPARKEGKFFEVALSKPTGDATLGSPSVSIIRLLGRSFLTDGLVAYYPLDGDARDFSGFGSDGMLVNVFVVSDGFGNPGSAANITGDGSYVQIPNSPQLTALESDNEFTISAWVRPGDNGFYEVCKYNPSTDGGWEIGVGSHANPVGVVRVDQNPWPGPAEYEYWMPLASLPEGWFHFAVTGSHKSQQVCWYVNGQRLGCKDATNFHLGPSGGPLYMGYSPLGPDETLPGQIDDLRIYSRALSDTEVLRLYEYEAGLAEMAPVIVSQPTSGNVFLGDTTRLEVLARGTSPLAYQWRKDGLNLEGATNTALVLTNASLSSVGDYAVVVTNDFGAVTSAVARVTVTPRSWPYVADFESTVGREWSHRQTDMTPLGKRRFLGQFGNDTVSLTLNGLPAHQGVTISFDLFVIFSWDGSYIYDPTGPDIDSCLCQPDIWEISLVGGPTLLHTTFSNTGPPEGDPTHTQAYPDDFPGSGNPARLGAVESNSLGYPMPWGDSVYRLSFTVPHSADTITLNYSGQGLQGVSDESWGLDNVRVDLLPTSDAPPVLRLQPSDVTALLGTPAAFIALAYDTAPLRYQWRFNGTPVFGATTNVLNVEDVQGANAGNYDVVVANDYGSVTSRVAVLTVLLQPPEITKQPADQSVLSGSSVSLSVLATGSLPVTYQWQRNETELSDDGRVSGAKTATLTISAAGIEDVGVYSVVVTNAFGVVRSQPVVLEVVSAPPRITEQPQNQSASLGSTVSLNIQATGSQPLSYQWQFEGVDIIDGPRVSGARTSKLQIENLRVADLGIYDVRASNPLGWIQSASVELSTWSPVLLTSMQESQLVVWWNEPGKGMVLQRTTSLASPQWEDVPGSDVTNRVVLPARSATEFFRLFSPMPPGLIAWWQGEGSAQDLVHGNNGTMMNGASFAAGLVGQAFTLDGVDDYVEFEHAQQFEFGTKPFSIVLWFYSAEEIGASRELFRIGPACCGGPENELRLLIEAQMLKMTLSRSSDVYDIWDGYVSDAVTMRVWHHVVLTRLQDHRTFKIYFDGVLNRTIESHDALYPSKAGPVIGKGDLDSCFKGMIDEVAVFDRELTEMEVRRLYEAGLAGKHWPAQ